MKTMTIKINDTAVIPYPSDELEDLKKLLKLDGMYTTIVENTKISRPTIVGIADKGQGQFAKVKALREFVIAWNKQFAA
jgi:hypothetical protein